MKIGVVAKAGSKTLNASLGLNPFSHLRIQIGAKVRELWQLREISGGGGYGGQNLQDHFGLGDATEADLVKIEWPSGPRRLLSFVSQAAEPAATAAKFDLNQASIRLMLAASPVPRHSRIDHDRPKCLPFRMSQQAIGW
jgi:hypothetical protein